MDRKVSAMVAVAEAKMQAPPSAYCVMEAPLVPSAANDNAGPRWPTLVGIWTYLGDRIDDSRLLRSSVDLYYHPYLPSSDQDKRKQLSRALSSPKLLKAVAPEFLRLTQKPDFSADEVFQSADDVTVALTEIIKAGLLTIFNPDGRLGKDEAARLSALPKPGAMPVWAEREKAGLGDLNPIEFYHKVWKDFLVGGIYLDELNARDAKLSRAIRAHCTRQGIEAGDVLPPPGYERTNRLASGFDEANARAVSNLEARKRMAGIRSGKVGALP